jgi:acid stress-induced BolA-like protein IbaG/YrbA
MTAEEIKLLIERGLPGARALVYGDDGVHFETSVISEAFAGLSMVKSHQLVYQCLGARMGAEIHALSIKTFTPEQWASAHPRAIQEIDG